jgi:thiopeptide-type bacteriocin biosynthesis protein
VAFDLDPPLERCIDAATQGATTEGLVDALVTRDPEISREEAESYVGSLVDAGLLGTELMPPVTTADPLGHVTSELEQRGLAEDAGRMCAIAGACAELEASPLGVATTRFDAIQGFAAPANAKRSGALHLQIDLERRAEGLEIDARLGEEIARGAELLYRVARKGPDPLGAFKRELVKRYEGRDVPLAHALDEDVGIGFPAVDVAAPASHPLDALLLRTLLACVARGETEIELGEGEISAAVGDRMPLIPDSVAVLGTIVGNPAKPSSEWDVALKVVTGPSSARLLGRFAVWSEDLAERVREELRVEEALRPAAVFAEVVHQPELSRSANVVVRPRLREHEIVLCATPGVGEEGRLRVDDLTVRVDGDRVVLRSRRLGREVLPRLSCAHNYGVKQIALYRFLCAAQDQGGGPGAGFDWGPLSDAPFLPRVRCGRVILSLATWRLDEDELKRVTDAEGEARLETVLALRSLRAIPRYVGYTEGDNVLPVDLENPIAVDAFVAATSGKRAALLTELLIGDDECVASGPDGPLVHEIIVPLRRRRAPRSSKARAPSRVPTARRSFSPGGPWLYAKLYVGVDAADRVLLEYVRPFVGWALGAGVADRWFFIRYADPDPHLRLRLHGEPHRLACEALTTLERQLEPLAASGYLQRLELGTYEREIERYGGSRGIELAEELFFADSAAALEVIDALSREPRKERWLWTLAGMDRMLADFGLDAAQKAELAERARAAFAAERREGAPEERLHDARFRELRAKIGKVMDPAGASGVHRALAGRSLRLGPIARHFARLEEKRAIRPGRSRLLESFLHMHVNRLVARDPRKVELDLYSLLARAYASEVARARRAGPA